MLRTILCQDSRWVVKSSTDSLLNGPLFQTSESARIRIRDPEAGMRQTFDAVLHAAGNKEMEREGAGAFGG